jgi:hypothetical protein
MKNIFHYALLLLTATACNNQQDDDNRIKDSSVTGIDTVQVTNKQATHLEVSGCYMRVLDRDTLVATLTEKGDSIYGKLSFDNYQKDGSSGTVNGLVEGDIIKLIYSFRSEGMKSVMEVYFKKDSSGIIRGVGEMNAKGDTAYYTKPATIEYPLKEKWNKMPCEQIAGKYQ